MALDTLLSFRCAESQKQWIDIDLDTFKELPLTLLKVSVLSSPKLELLICFKESAHGQGRM